jgi:hypothetical protein
LSWVDIKWSAKINADNLEDYDALTQYFRCGSEQEKDWHKIHDI